MDEIISNLGYDYQIQLHLLRQSIDQLNTHDRGLAIAWSNKLKTCESSVQEATLRNDFLYYLVRCACAGKLQPPFNEPPPKGPLLNILNLLPQNVRDQKAKKAGSDKRKAELFERSPDKGAFLAGQPVPRCGAFCYLAVISKGPEDKEGAK